MTGPQAIETSYKGYRFRSRIEARWAVFFDALGVEWEYERQGFDLPSGKYLPDFWLPTWGLWVEIKGAHPNAAEMRLAQELAEQDSGQVLILWGNVPGRFLAFSKHGVFPLWGDVAGWLVRPEDGNFEAAVEAARSARFEHGETPEVRRAVARPKPGANAERELIRALLHFPGRLEVVAERLDPAAIEDVGLRAIYEQLLSVAGEIPEFWQQCNGSDIAPLAQQLTDEYRLAAESDIDDGLAFIRARELDRKMQRIDRMLPYATEAEQTELIRSKAELRKELSLLGRRARAFRR